MVLVERLAVIPFRFYVAAAVSAAVLALASWWHLARVHAAEKAVHAHYAVVLADIRDKTAAAAAEFRQRETAWQTRFDKEAADGQTRIDAARRDADGARRERDGLRADLDRYRAAARSAAHPGATAAGPTAADAIDVLADMFSRADEVAGELAAALDLAHAAGITCERAADALTNPRRPDGGTNLSISP